ncbi:response regulator [bacterium]|nr:response regulator [bacterium]
MANETILVVEDEEDILDLVTYHFEQAGFKILKAMAGDRALEVLQRKSADLVILDLMLPGLSGIEVCKILRGNEETRNIPIIMLTAKKEEIDRVLGFELGADDYVPKPFSPRELVLRTKAILRRAKAPEDRKDVIQIGELSIDKPKHQVVVAGNVLDLTATEFNLLVTLVERKGRVQTREMLLESVWGYEYAGFTRTVDTHMRRLRSKLGLCGDLIETVRGVGYRFRVPEEA